MCSMVCSVSVLLPMPGSPPSNTMLPGTKPPPNTRSSSPSPVLMRGSSFAEISRKRMGRLWFDDIAERTDWAAERAAFVPVSAETLISLYVFHCPHAGHLPIHFADSCPQLEHTYIVLSLAISHFVE